MVKVSVPMPDSIGTLLGGAGGSDSRVEGAIASAAEVMLLTRSVTMMTAVLSKGRSRKVLNVATLNAWVGALRRASMGTTAGASYSNTSLPPSTKGAVISARVRAGLPQKSASSSFSGPGVTAKSPAVRRSGDAGPAAGALNTAHARTRNATLAGAR